MNVVSFTQMKDGTFADYQLLARHERTHAAGLAGRLLSTLAQMDHGLGGYRISRLEHSLQTATRAEGDGADVDMVVGALLHDIGDELAPDNHAQLAAAILRPYVRAEVTWVVEMHGLFQMTYYAAHRGLDPDGRDAHREAPFYASCASFCERWDQASFDPAFASRTLDHFVPMVATVFARAPFDPSTGCL